jgi:hypothetical protein
VGIEGGADSKDSQKKHGHLTFSGFMRRMYAELGIDHWKTYQSIDIIGHSHAFINQ